MKIINQIITQKLKVLITISLIFSSFNIFSQSTPIFPNPAGVPELISGTDLQVGARYLYRDVQINVNGTGSNADALLTIIDINNITVNNVDSTLGVENRFEPSTTTTAAGGFVEWELIFVQSGTATAISDGTSIPLDSFTLEAIDVDGDEFFEVVVPDSYTLETTPASELVVSTNGNFTRFQSDADFAAGIDVANTEFVVAVTYTNVSTVRFKNGRSISGGLRQNSVSFLGEVNFANPNTVTVNNAPIVINNIGNTVLENSTGNSAINVLIGSSDIEGNIDSATVALIDPNDPTNVGVVGTPLIIVGVGTYTIDNLGNVIFTPATSYIGNANVNFRVEDALGATSNTAVLEITVLGDADADGIDDVTDLDDDNDGITDLVESGGNDPDGDEDNDGIPNYRDNSDDGNGGLGGTTDYTDTNNDGIPDVYDLDGDGVPNHLDLDSDNDGIYDVVEIGNDILDGNDDGQIDGVVGANGIPDAAEDSGIDGNGVSGNPIDTDGDAIPNHLDVDSDNDNCPDANEAYNIANADTNGDGTFGGVIGAGQVNPNGTVNVTGIDYTIGTNVNVVTAVQVTIDVAPVNQVVIAGNNVTFSVVASAISTTTFSGGVPNFNIPPASDVSTSITYQWQVDSGSGFTDIPGETNPTLVLTAVPSTDNGNVYRVIVNHPDNICVNEQPSAILTVESPALDAQKTAAITDDGDGILGANDIITYTITVENTGNVVLNNIILSDFFQRLGGGLLALDSGPTFVSADQGSAEGDLLIGEIANYTATYTITQADVNAGGVINRVTAMGDTPAGVMVNDTADDGDDADGDTDDDPTVTIIPPVPELTLTKTGVIGGTGILGDVITYTFSVENTGNVTINNVIIDDPLTGSVGLVITPSTLAPGETGTATATYTIIQANIDAGFVENSATVTGQDGAGIDVTDISDAGDETVETPDGNGGTDGDTTNDPTVIILQQNPELTLTKTGVLLGGVIVGDEIEYTFSVENTGDVTIDNIIIDDPLTGSVGLPVAPSTLAPGETGTVTARYTITQANIDASFVENSATVTGQDPDGIDVTDISDAGDEAVETPDGNGGTDGDTTNDPTVILLSAPELTLTKTGVLLGGVIAGDEIEYTFNVENTGNVTINNVTIDDPLTGSVGLLVTPSTLAPGETGTVTARYTITQADINAGFVENSATVTGQDDAGIDVTDVSDAGDEAVETPDGNGGTDGDTTNDPTVILLPSNPGLTLTKTAQISRSGAIGDDIIYTFTVQNTGNIAINNITVEDVLTGSVGVNTLVINPSTLAPGEIGTATATYIITQADLDRGFIENSATVTGQDPDGINVTDISDAGDETIETPDGNDNTNGDPTDDPTVVILNQNSDLTLTKTGVVTGAGLVGDEITYTFRVENTGNQTITNVTIDDVLTGSTGVNVIVLNPSTLFPNDVGIATATYIITQTDIDAGFVQNSATVTGQNPAGNDITDVSDAGDENIETPDGNGNTNSDPTDDPTVIRVPLTASIEAEKTAVVTDNGNGELGAGDLITYTITITNTGDLTLNNVALIDTLLDVDGNTLNLDSGPSFVNADLGSLEGNLLAGEVATYTATYTITQSDVQAGGVTNSVLVSGDEPFTNVTVNDVSDDGDDTDGNTDDDTTDVLITANPELTLTKTANVAGTGTVGDVITYTFSVLNSGNVTITNITIDDALTNSTALIITPNSLEPGEVGVATATYTITQLDVDQRFVENSAIVNGEDLEANTISDISDAGNETVETPDSNGNTNGDPTDDPTVTILTPQSSGIVVFDGISPNGDGVNDVFRVEGLQNFPNNNVKIFNRWGVEVFSQGRYHLGPFFSGRSDGRATIRTNEELPAGVYYYVVTYEIDGRTESQAGPLYITR
ncbi:DUF11 domain-containing protein [Flavobacteriaceae bacterium AU392]|nr:DUF11 domain-containing protein [Flavobacteriaceae bacterium]RKM81146.1 DUF11 domain-containing protein [Flavobacteriaceae bacterium AU392]